MKACIRKRFASGIVGKSRRREDRFVLVDEAGWGGGACGFEVYMAKFVERGAVSSISTCSVCNGGQLL